MAEIAQAVLFILQENGRTSADVFREDDDTSSPLDPFHRAQGLWEAVEDDFPNAVHSIALNQRARELMSNTRLVAMGLEPQY